MDYEQIINNYRRAIKQAVARRDMVRAAGLGERMRQWIQTAEAAGHYDDNGQSAFAIGRAR